MRRCATPPRWRRRSRSASAEEAVRHSEAQLRSFVANSPFGISSASILQDRFLSANPALVRMLGYDTEEELLALRITRDVYCQPEGRRAFLAQLPHSGDFSGIETHWRRKDKKHIIVRSSGRVIRDPEVPDEGTSRASRRTSRNSGCWKSSFSTHRRWRRWEDSRAASRTTSTI